MIQSQRRPDIPDGTHPIATGKYIFLTAPINALADQMKLWFTQRVTGGMVVGDQRLGKTRARQCMKKILTDSFPGVPVIEVPCRHEKVPTERNFFMHLLECADHAMHETKRREAHILRHRLNEYLKARAEGSNLKWVILLLDDAQTLSESQYTWLMDIHNEMNDAGIHLGCYLFGQKELFDQRTAFRMAKKYHLVGRFMLHSFKFKGIITYDEFEYCLRGYDETEYPVGSGWSFTRYFFPEAFNEAWRITSLGGILWDAFLHASTSETKPRQMEIPMEFFVRTLEQLLLNNKDRNVHVDPLTYNEIITLIKNTGFYEFRDNIPTVISIE